MTQHKQRRELEARPAYLDLEAGQTGWRQPLYDPEGSNTHACADETPLCDGRVSLFSLCELWLCNVEEFQAERALEAQEGVQDRNFEGPQADEENKGRYLEAAEKGEEVGGGDMILIDVRGNLELVGIGLHNSLNKEND